MQLIGRQKISSYRLVSISTFVKLYCSPTDDYFVYCFENVVLAWAILVLN